MGITTDEFFENIYNVIFAPKLFFEKKEVKISIRVAIGTLVLVSVISKIAAEIVNGSVREELFILKLIGAVLGTIIIWFLTGLFFEYTAKIFNKGGNLEKILYYTSFAPVPYIFFAPFNLLKNLGEWGYIFASNIELIIYIWIIILYAFSLRTAYNISLSRSFMLIILPFLASFFAIYWMIGFFTKIWYIFSI